MTTNSINNLPLTTALDTSNDRLLVYRDTTKSTYSITPLLLGTLLSSAHTHTSSDITDFTEAAQDAVGAMVNSTLSYVDATPSLGVVDNTSTQKVQIAKAGTLTGTRHKINFIEGSNVTLTVSDDSTNDKVDVTIASSSTAWGSITGTLSSQTDLQTILNAKLAASAVSAFGLTLVDDADAATARTTLGLGSIATQASSSISISGGTITGITDLAVADGGTGSSTASGARTNLGAASTTQTDFISGLIPTVADGTYKLIIQAPYAGTITHTITQCTAGTSTATWKVNTTALGGTNAVSTTKVDTTQSSSNTFASGDDIQVTFSSSSSCANLSFTIVFTRTLS